MRDEKQHRPSAHPAAIIHQLDRLRHTLTEPSPDLASVPQRRQARLLASFLLFLLLATVALYATVVLFAPPGTRLVSLASAVLTLAPLAASYLLSRTARYRLGAVLAILSLSAVTCFLVLARSLDATYLIYLVISVLFSSMFLSHRATVAVAVFNLFGFGLFAASPNASPERIAEALIFYLLISGLSLVAAYHRNLLEEDRHSQLAGSEALFRTLSEKALVGVYIIQDGRFRYVNPALADIFGYQPQEIIGRMGPEDLTAPEDRPKVLGKIRRRLQGEIGSARYQLRGLRKDGTHINCEVLGRRADYDGRPAIVGTLLDVTERKEAMEALRRSEERLRTYFEQASDWIFTLDASGRIDNVNKKVSETTGYTAAELIGRRPTELLRGQESQRVQDLVTRLIRGEDIDQAEIEIELRNGRRVWLEVRGRALYDGDEFLGTFHIARDVTERKRAEEAEREQRVLAEALRDTATVLNSTLDLDQVLDRILDNVGDVVPNDGANIMLVEGNHARVVRCRGYYGEHGFADKVMNLTFPIDETVNMQQMAQSGRPCIISDAHNHEDWVLTPATRWVRSYVGAPIRRQNRVIGFLNLDSATPHFFTEKHAERLQAFADQVAIALHNARLYQELENYSETLERAVDARTAELQRTMEQLAVTLNNSPDAILLLKEDGTVEAANPAFTELFGYEEGEIRRHSPESLAVGDDAGSLIRALHTVIDAGRRRRLELVAKRRDGSTFDADVALAPVKEGETVQGAVCSLRDISRLKEVDRMKDAFVSNVSHELRTPITSLRLYHDLLVQNPSKKDVYVARIRREVDRLNVIIEDLLQLSRLDRGRMNVELQEVDLNDLVDQFVDDRTPLFQEKGLRLSRTLSPAAPPVCADKSLLEQLLSILVTNALNYTPVGGRVTVSVAPGQDSKSGQVGCSVEDTGPGIPPEEQPHLFDRFFRGQAAHEANVAGTGLGLAIAREIVERHNGSISVESSGRAGEGATFTVWLPAFAE